MADNLSASAAAGGVLAAAILDTLEAKALLTRSDAREILKRSLAAITIHKTPESYDAGNVIISLLQGRFSERS